MPHGIRMRLAAIVGAIAMLGASLVGASTASADTTVDLGTLGNTITINNISSGQLTGHTLKYYKLASIEDLGYQSAGSTTLVPQVVTTTDATLAGLITTAANTATGTTLTGDTMTALMNTANDTTSNTASAYSGTIRNFVTNLTTASGFTGITPTGTKTVTDTDVSNGTLTLDVGEPGIYLITDTTTDGTTTSIPMLVATKVTASDSGNTVVDGFTGTIDLKNVTPTITKTIATADTTKEVGKTVTYTINTTVPNYSEFNSTNSTGYVYQLHDTLNSKLTYASITSVTIDGTVLDSTDYTITQSSTDNSFTIDLSTYMLTKINASDYSLAGKTVTVVYTATVTTADTASDGKYTGLENTASTEYSHDPTDTTSTTTVEITDKPKTFNFAVTLKKTNTDGDALKGATFGIYDGTTLVKTVTTGDNGTIDITGLAAGTTYTVKETSSPDGYMLLPSMSFTLNITATYYDADGTEITDTSKQQYADHAVISDVTYDYGNANTLYGNGTISATTSNGASTATVINYKNIAQMSPTGAAGIGLYLLIAVALAGIGFAVRRLTAR